MTKSLILAGGCFWCVEHDLRHAPGVVQVISGYSGGDTSMPTYEDHTGHREVVLVEYDDSKTSYKKVLQYFLDHIDPTDNGGQFGDRGGSYTPAIFYETKEEEDTARLVLEELAQSGVYSKQVVVEVCKRKAFYKAEEYHQNYAEKNPTHYGLYRLGSGREGFVQNTCAIREEKHIPWKE
jgi:methionine-S-sulfoxide reductase